MIVGPLGGSTSIAGVLGASGREQFRLKREALGQFAEDTNTVDRTDAKQAP